MAHKKSNADHLRELINSDSYSKEEALEFIAAMEEELTDEKQEVKDLKEEKDLLQEEIDNQPALTKVFLGLDTLHYHLEQGNLRIQLQLEDFLNQIKSTNGAGVLMPG